MHIVPLRFDRQEDGGVMQAVLYGTILFALILAASVGLIAYYLHAPPVCCAHEEDR
jgi:hypothetical protein